MVNESKISDVADGGVHIHLPEGEADLIDVS